MKGLLLPLLAIAFAAARADEPAETAWGAAAAIRLEHAVAPEVAESLNALLAGRDGVRLAEARADENDNTVLLFARSERDLATMRELVARQDVARPSFVFETAVFAIGSATNRATAYEWFLCADGRETPGAEADARRGRWFATTARSRDELLSAASSNGNARLAGSPICRVEDEQEAVVEHSDAVRDPDGSTQTFGFRLSLTPRARKDGCVSLGAKIRFLPENDLQKPADDGIDVLLRPGETLAWGGFPREDGSDRLVLIRLRPDEDAEAVARAQAERLARESAAFAHADPGSRFVAAPLRADAADAPPAVPLDLSVRFVELTDAALTNDFFRAAFAGTDSNSSEPVSDDVATFTQIFTEPQTDLLLLRLTNEFGCRATFRQTQRWNGGDAARFSFRTSVFRYRNGAEAPVEERESGLFLSVDPVLEALSSNAGDWRVTLGLSLADVGRPSPETPAGADGVYPERPFVPVRKLATSVDIWPGSVVFFRAGDGTTHSPLVIVECNLAAPLPEAPAVPPPATPTEAVANDGWGDRIFTPAPDAFKFLSLATDCLPRRGTLRLDVANVNALFAALGFGTKDNCIVKSDPELPARVFFIGSQENARAFEEALEIIGSRPLPSYEIDLESVLVERENLPAFLEAVGAKDNTAAAFGTVLATFPSRPAFRAAVGPAAEVSRDVAVSTFAGAPGSASAVTEYIYPTRYAFYAATNGAEGAATAPAVHVEPQAFTTRTVGTTFEARPLPAEEDGAVPLFVRIERRGDPTWFNQIPELPVRGADGTVERVKTFLEQPLFPERTVAATLRLKPGAVALLQGAPDFEDETRVRFPAVSLVPVENFRRSEPAPAPDPGDAEARRASRRAVMLRNDQP